MPTAVFHSPQELTSLYGQLSFDEQQTIFSLMELFVRNKLNHKPTDWQSFIIAAKNNHDELPQMPRETPCKRQLFSDWVE